MCGKGAPSRAIIDGLLAQRRLDGDKTIIARDTLSSWKSLLPRAKDGRATQARGLYRPLKLPMSKVMCVQGGHSRPRWETESVIEERTLVNF